MKRFILTSKNAQHHIPNIKQNLLGYFWEVLGSVFNLSLHVLLSKFPVKYLLLMKGQELT